MLHGLIYLINVFYYTAICSFPRDIKYDLLIAYFKCKWVVFRKGKSITVKIGRYTLSSPSPKPFKSLLFEILIKEEYKIDLGTDTPNIIDCGSNIGMSVLYFKLKYPLAKITAIEADSDTFNVLQENLRQFNDVTAYNCYVSNTDDESVDFYTGGVGDISASALKDRGVNHQVAKTISLRKLMDNKVINLLKMDIEAGEFIVFNVGEDVAFLKRIDNIILEYHQFIQDQLKPVNSMADFLKIFEQKNFAYMVYTPSNIPAYELKNPMDFNTFIIRMKRYFPPAEEH